VIFPGRGGGGERKSSKRRRSKLKNLLVKRGRGNRDSRAWGCPRKKRGDLRKRRKIRDQKGGRRRGGVKCKTIPGEGENSRHLLISWRENGGNSGNVNREVIYLWAV